jgi:hypothetical protein
MTEPEFGTEHTEAHNVVGGMESHEHLHGTGDGQHVHEGWVPDRVIERLKRDGFCGERVGESACMRRDVHEHEEQR